MMKPYTSCTDGKLAAYVEVVFPNQAMLVWADAMRSGALAEFLQVAPVLLLVVHVTFSSTVRRKASVSFYYQIFHCMDILH